MNNREYIVSYYDNLMNTHRSRAFAELAQAELFVELRRRITHLYSQFTITIVYNDQYTQENSHDG